MLRQRKDTLCVAVLARTAIIDWCFSHVLLAVGLCRFLKPTPTTFVLVLRWAWRRRTGTTRPRRWRIVLSRHRWSIHVLVRVRRPPQNIGCAMPKHDFLDILTVLKSLTDEPPCQQCLALLVEHSALTTIQASIEEIHIIFVYVYLIFICLVPFHFMLTRPNNNPCCRI